MAPIKKTLKNESGSNYFYHYYIIIIIFITIITINLFRVDNRIQISMYLC